MKIPVVFVGFIVLLLGLLPLLFEQEIMPMFLSFLPSASLFYQIGSIVLGIVLIYYGFKKA